MSTSLFTKQVVCPGCGIKFPARTNYIDKKFEEISSHQDAVNKFMRLGQQEVPEKPTVPSSKIRELRAKLILEEALETIHALGFDVEFDSDHMVIGSGCNSSNSGFEYRFFEARESNLKEIIDGCCDLRVVTTGTLSACGVNDIRPQELVDDNNLNKFHWTDHQLANYFDNLANFGSTWTRREIDGEVFTIVWNKDGKVIKPPGHKPPLIDKEIERQANL